MDTKTIDEKTGYPPKETWGDGPWQHEPDRDEWRDAATGYPCLIVRNQFGALCGYVGLPPGHPLHGKSYSEAHDNLAVHRGLTYADKCQGDICHVAKLGEPDDVWWLGFDCAQAFDIVPAMEALIGDRKKQIRKELKISDEDVPDYFRESYKTIDYVKAEVTELAAQLKAAEVSA